MLAQWQLAPGSTQTLTKGHPGYQSRARSGGHILRRQAPNFDVQMCIAHGVCPSGVAPMAPGALSVGSASSGGTTYTFGPGAHPEQKYITHGEQVGVTGAGILPLQEMMAQKELNRQVEELNNSNINNTGGNVSSGDQFFQPPIPVPVLQSDTRTQMSLEEAQIPQQVQTAEEPVQKSTNWILVAVGVGILFLLLGTKGSSRKASL